MAAVVALLEMAAENSGTADLDRGRTDDANYVFKNERSLPPPQQRAALDVGLTFRQITQ